MQDRTIADEPSEGSDGVEPAGDDGVQELDVPDESSEAPPAHRGRGRPRGSKTRRPGAVRLPVARRPKAVPSKATRERRAQDREAQHSASGPVSLSDMMALKNDLLRSVAVQVRAVQAETLAALDQRFVEQPRAREPEQARELTAADAPMFRAAVQPYLEQIVLSHVYRGRADVVHELDGSRELLEALRVLEPQLASVAEFLGRPGVWGVVSRAMNNVRSHLGARMRGVVRAHVDVSSDGSVQSAIEYALVMWMVLVVWRRCT